jgi:hypothetical protein
MALPSVRGLRSRASLFVGSQAELGNQKNLWWGGPLCPPPPAARDGRPTGICLLHILRFAQNNNVAKVRRVPAPLILLKPGPSPHWLNTSYFALD